MTTVVAVDIKYITGLKFEDENVFSKKKIPRKESLYF